jgi:branched-chain amino acid transport system substrate-binding protein
MSEQKNKVFVGSGAGTALLTGEMYAEYGPLDLRHYAYGRGLERPWSRRAARNGSS